MSTHLPESWRHELALLREELDALDTDSRRPLAPDGSVVGVVRSFCDPQVTGRRR